ncbi:MAG TPA: AAA family ATPase, partial [Blastocatellia bacterium]|nr:AAA family ATPase [Blastocatellia bacterium]
ILDTDAFATAIWHIRYMGERSQEVEAIVASHRRPDLYLVTDVDTPFVEDGTRDGELIRDWMHNAFIEQLTGENRRFEILRGSLQERVRQAIEHIESVIGSPAGHLKRGF